MISSSSRERLGEVVLVGEANKTREGGELVELEGERRCHLHILSSFEEV
jgi:hypothetical protein